MSEPSSPSADPDANADRQRGPGEVFCRNCGAVISAEAELCPGCGVRQRPSPESSLDSALDQLLNGGNPFVAAVLSAILPGLGQLYNRELERGIVFMLAGILALLSVVVLVGFVLYPVVWVYAIYDAYKHAEATTEPSETEREDDSESPDSA